MTITIFGKKLLILTTIAVLATYLMLVPIPASAMHVACGAMLTSDTKLDENLSCPGTALEIGADGIKVDLNGFTLTNIPIAASSFGVDNTGGFDDVKIKNGAIIGFEQGIRGIGVSGFNLDNLSFFGQTSSHAIDILDSPSVKIKNSFFSMPTAFIGPEAIRLESVDSVEVKGVTVVGGFVGVNFACGSCDGTEPKTNGKVEKSIFVRTFIGVLVANSDDATIKNNIMADGVTVICPAGFCAAVPITLDAKGISIGGFGIPITGTNVIKNELFNNDGLGLRAIDADTMNIRDNHVHSNTGDGILLDDGDTSTISKNRVTNNGGDGISLTAGSIGNAITKNRADDNTGTDLIHDVGSSPNTWTLNSCVTKSGADIPAC